MALGGWVYIMTNKPRGIPYVGVTYDIAARRAAPGRQGSSFCRKYNLTRLVLAEPYESILDAIAREKAMKEWKREWKIALVEASNPDWRDLFETINC